MSRIARQDLARSRYLGNKWLKHKTLTKDPVLIKHIPATAILNSKNLQRFISKQPVVFLKPIKGTAGIGIMRIIRKKGILKLQSGMRVWRTRNIKRLYSYVIRQTRKQAYLIQVGIPIIRLKRRPIDFRVILYRPYNKWIVQGVMGKLAAPQKYVTNHHRGGSPITLQKALKRTLKFSNKRCHHMEARLISLSSRIGIRLNKTYKNLRELGIDLAIDKHRKIWILEANTRPMYELFRYHSNKKLYQKIVTVVRKTRVQG